MTSYIQDVAGGLPQVIVETTGGNSDLYLTGLAQFQSNGWVYQHSDGLGSTRHLTDPSGQVTLAQSYDPFGGLLSQDGAGTSGFGYTGEQQDASTGLVFLRARYYDPAVGRFVSKDPWPGHVLRPNTMQGYGYAGNNPVLHTDPSGRDYIENVDRYTCDDPNVSGGYSQHVDRATGSFGLWSCIVNPANLSSISNLQVIPESDGRYPTPVGGQFSYQKTNPPAPTYSYSTPPYLPLLLDAGCPIPNPAPNEPQRFRINGTSVDIIFFPPSNTPKIEANENKARARFFGGVSLGMDFAELYLLGSGSPGFPDAAAILGDIPISTLGSYYSGETYLYQKPYESLPPMTVIGQDVIFTTAEAAGPALVKAVGALVGGTVGGGVPGAIVGFSTGTGIDVISTSASLVYDGGRLFGVIPTYISLAILWDRPPNLGILIRAQEK